MALSDTQKHALLRHLDGKRMIAVPLADTIAADVEAGTDKFHQIAFSGEFEGHHSGPFSIEDGDLDSMVETFNARKIDPPVDFDHSTVFGGGPAAGWITAMRREGSNLEAKIEFNKRGREAVLNKEYRYFSPTIQFSKHSLDLETFEVERSGAEKIHSVALTNTPFLEDLPEATLSAVPDIRGTAPEEKPAMKKEQFATLAKALGFGPEVDPDLVVAAAKNAVQQTTAFGELAKMIGLSETTTPNQLAGHVKALADKVEGLEEIADKYEAQKAELSKVQAEERVAKARKEGKVTEQNRDWAEGLALSNPEMFDSWAECAPAVVPLSTKTPKTSATAPAVATENAALAAKTHMSPEDFEKYSNTFERRSSWVNPYASKGAK